MFERELPPTSACPFILAVEIPSTRLVYLFKSSLDLKVEQMGADVYKCGMCTSQQDLASMLSGKVEELGLGHFKYLTKNMVKM